DAIEEATGEPVRRIMDTWIFQGGHPAIAVEADGSALTLRQRRFRYLADDGDATWEVPVLVSVDGGEAEKHLLGGDPLTIEVGDPARAVVNAGGHGFYRVAYSPDLLHAIGDRLDDLQPVERSLLLDDTWAAVLA